MRYPIGVQSFENIVERGYVYVDKTDLVYDLAKEHVCFLCRPRRFGKSLLISTLDAYFKGRKELFAGLRMEQLEQDWTVYPVFRIDFAGADFHNPEELAGKLDFLLRGWEREYGVEEKACTFSDRMQIVLREARVKTGHKAVVLIDEYDKPLLDVIGEDLEQKHRDILKGFYGTFKAADEDLRFVLLTGVTKFSQISVFSGFNQPNDISLDPHYEAICGITEEELYSVFDESIEALAAKRKLSVDEAKDLLKRQYDGYHFSEEMTDIYNPFSLIYAFDKKQLEDYWYRSGTPTFLAKLISGHNINMDKLLAKSYPTTMFIDYRADISDPLAMLYQSGYITIKDYDSEDRVYRLDYPNAEVRRGFTDLVANDYYGKNVELTPWTVGVSRCLREGRLDDLQDLFVSFFADIDYQAHQKLKALSYEEHFHYTFYLIMKILSCYRPLIEKQNSRGRCDMVVETPKFVYIFEFKLNGKADEALQQIADKGYAEPYQADLRQVYRIGVGFSQETNGIAEWKVE